MDESESKNEKLEEEQRFDPVLLKKGLRCDRWQNNFLKECSEKGEEGIKKWNKWRKKNKTEDIYLEGANFNEFYLERIRLDEDPKYGKVHLEGAKFRSANLKSAKLSRAHLENTDFNRAVLIGAYLQLAHLEGADFSRSYLMGAQLPFCTVDGNTIFLYCKVSRHTWFYGVGLDRMRIDPEHKQLLKYNIRRTKWERWYQWKDWYEGYPQKERNRIARVLRCPIRAFWEISDYGLRTWRIITTFLGLAIAFAVIYWLFPSCVMVNCVVGDIRGLWHALYFSVVTMTTLGFGDIAANPDSWAGQTLLMLQVILGYVLLGALVTRFAVLFTAGGPAGKFADEKEKETKESKSE